MSLRKRVKKLDNIALTIAVSPIPPFEITSPKHFLQNDVPGAIHLIGDLNLISLPIKSCKCSLVKGLSLPIKYLPIKF